eukprot:XP_001691237.1 glyoxal or galactose oxidase [Chlamydomonas reinhardtii]
MKSIRTFNRSCTDLQLRKLREMNWRRWYPSATLLPDGRALVMGGTQGVGAGTANNPFWEIYDWATNGLQQFAMRPGYLDSANQPVPRLRGYATTQFPYTGTSVMLGLYPENNYQVWECARAVGGHWAREMVTVEIMLFGGQKEAANKDLSLRANRGANRLKLYWDPAISNYTFDGWAEEMMTISRVMPDSVLLPNGQVVVLNGAQTGLAGDSASGGDSRADYPVLYAELYDPDARQGQRFTQLGWTQIPRMYHSTACLTTNGTIIVAGCDRCYRYTVNDGWDYVASPAKADYRVELFQPPFFFMDNLKPAIVSIQSDKMAYGGTFRITYAFPSVPSLPNGVGNGNNNQLRITRAVLVAPCSCTHSFNTHQRLVGLEILSDNAATGALVVRGPPDIYTAPPGMYMLFLLNGPVYSRASWVLLQRP